MLTVEQINRLIGVDESFHASYRLMEVLKDEYERNKLFEDFLKLETDLSYDWFPTLENLRIERGKVKILHQAK